MAKKLIKGQEETLSALDKMYAKYGKSEQIFNPPSSLEDIDLSVERLINPFLSFDRYLGGAPAYGKITTYSAFASCGKTSLALAIAGVNKDKIIGFCDNEFNWSDSSYIWIDKYFGIEKERIHILQPTYLEEGAEMVEDLCEVADIVIFDGFDSLAPKGEYQATMEEQQMGLQARAYKKFFRRSMGKIYKSRAALLITNHLYENIGNVYEPFKEPGGRAIHDFASQKLYLTRSNIKDPKTKKTIGQEVNVTVNKDKLSGNRGAKFNLPYDNRLGFDIEMDIINNAVDLEVVDQAGSWFSYNGTKIGQGKESVREVLKDNPDLVEEIKQACKDKF
jgi:recombination protein RecA